MKVNPEKVFLLFAIVFGIAFAFLTPPFQAPDEYNHFFRAYEISTGSLISKKLLKTEVSSYESRFIGMDEEASEYVVGDHMPSGLLELTRNISEDIPSNISNKQDPDKIFRYLLQKNKSGDTEFTNFPNTALYSPVPYIPQATAILISRIFGLPYLVMFYMSRIFNLIAYVCLIFCSLSLLKSFKMPLLIVTLMPMSLFLAGSVSPDAVLIGTCVFLFSLTFAMGMDASGGSKRYSYLFLLASIFLGFMKMVYFPIPLILLVFGKKHFKLALFGFLMSLSSMFLWQSISSQLYVPLRIGVDPASQQGSILGDVFGYLKIMWDTLIGNREQIATQIVGNFGWLDTPLNAGFVFFYFVLLLSSILLAQSSKLGLRVRLIPVFVGSLICFFIIVAMYLSWTPVGNKEILGVVGKNFIPVLPLFIPLFYGLLSLVKDKLLDGLIVVSISLSLGYSIYVLVIRFYLMLSVTDIIFFLR